MGSFEAPDIVQSAVMTRGMTFASEYPVKSSHGEWEIPQHREMDDIFYSMLSMGIIP